MDLMQREGKYNVPPQAGNILGVEFSGVIEQLGDGDIGDFKVGDEVFGLAYGGMIIFSCGFWRVLMVQREHMLSTSRHRQKCSSTNRLIYLGL